MRLTEGLRREAGGQGTAGWLESPSPGSVTAARLEHILKVHPQQRQAAQALSSSPAQPTRAQKAVGLAEVQMYEGGTGRGTSGTGPRNSPEGGRHRSTYQADKAAHEPHQAKQLPQPFLLQRCVLQPGLQGATVLRHMFQAHAPHVTGGGCAKTSCGYFYLEVRSRDRGSAPAGSGARAQQRGRPTGRDGQWENGLMGLGKTLNTVSTCLIERSREVQAQGGQGAPKPQAAQRE